MHIHVSNMLRRPFAVMATVAVIIAATGIMAFTAGASATNSKVAVCHKTGTDTSASTSASTYHLIVVSTNALSAHLGHGDGEPGDAVPTMTGWHFGDNCAPTVDPPTEPPIGTCFTVPSIFPAFSFTYEGPIDSLGNVSAYPSTDCSGDTLGAVPFGLISAETLADATIKCDALIVPNDRP